MIIDSLGEFEGMNRLYHALGLPPLNKPLAIWADTKDVDDNRRHDYRKRKDVKLKRVHDRVAKNKEEEKADMRAKKQKLTHETSIALAVEEEEGSAVEDADADDEM